MNDKDYSDISKYPITEADIGLWFEFKKTPFCENLKLIDFNHGQFCFKKESGYIGIIDTVFKESWDADDMQFIKRLIPQPGYKFKDCDPVIRILKYSPTIIDVRRYEIVKNFYYELIPFNEYLFKKDIKDWPEVIKYIYNIKE